MRRTTALWLGVPLAGAAGTVLRWSVARGPWSVAAVNVAGALLLGLLVRRVRADWARPVLGTGLLGGFTTMSAFAVDVDSRLADRPLAAFALLVATCAAGALAARLGSA